MLPFGSYEKRSLEFQCDDEAQGLSVRRRTRDFSTGNCCLLAAPAFAAKHVHSHSSLGRIGLLIVLTNKAADRKSLRAADRFARTAVTWGHRHTSGCNRSTVTGSLPKPF